MYTNIPTEELKHIIENTLKNNLVNSGHIQEIITLYDLIVKQNYFSIMNNFGNKHQA
jgi:ribosome-binding factor A